MQALPLYIHPTDFLVYNGNYILAELDGTVSKMHYAAFRVVPYLARERVTVPLHIPEEGVEEGEQLTEDSLD